MLMHQVRFNKTVLRNEAGASEGGGGGDATSNSTGGGATMSNDEAISQIKQNAAESLAVNVASSDAQKSNNFGTNVKSVAASTGR